MLKIRLQRMGKKKSPSYRLIVSEHTKDTQAGSLEILGQYDPTKTPKIMNFKADRILHWIGKGAAPSASVSNLLVNAGIIKANKQKSVVITNKRQGKLDEKKAAAAEAAKAEKEAAEEAKRQAEEAKKAEEEAAKAAEAEAAAPAEAPAEEAPAEAPAEEAPAETPAEEPKEEAPAEEKAEEAPAEEAPAAPEAEEEKAE